MVLASAFTEVKRRFTEVERRSTEVKPRSTEVKVIFTEVKVIFTEEKPRSTEVKRRAVSSGSVCTALRAPCFLPYGGTGEGETSEPASAGALLAGLEKAHFGNLNH